ncbi:amino acid ABC transporter permease [Flexivirga caeni]|nr:amino acid ABC transporter permease [Flexivirga caeni]
MILADEEHFGQPTALTGKTNDVSVPVKVVAVRRYGTWALGLAVLAVLAFVVRAFARANIEYSLIPGYLVNRSILTGVAHTLELTLLAMAVGLALGVMTAVMRQTHNPVLRGVALGYTWLFRGTPLLVQLLIWFNLSIVFKNLSFFGLYSTPMNTLMTPFVAALLGLGVNEGAYIAEIVRSGIISVDDGQSEAAAALGMPQSLTMRRVVLPQALRVIVPPLGNEFIALLKYSSLAYTISYTELLQSANKIYTTNFKVIELLFTVSIWYILLTTVFTVFQQILERRVGRGHTRPTEGIGRRLAVNLMRFRR